MQADPFQTLILHAKNALIAAEISSKEYSALQLHALEAESKAAACEVQQVQAVAEAQAYQQQCQDLQQQLAEVRQHLAAVQSAYASNTRQLKSANDSLTQAHQEVRSLQDQLSSATQEQHQQRSSWQEQVQQLQAELATAHSSRDLLLQQLQQQEAQLQELLDSAAAQAAVVGANDDEPPTTHCEDIGTLSSQHQQQHNIDVLKTQVCRLLDDNAVLQVRNESLDKQLGMSKLELARIQQQLAAAVQELPHQQKQQQAPEGQSAQQQEQEQSSMQGKIVHDKAYYKRRYIEIRDRYDALKQQKKHGCLACRAVQANERQDNGHSRLGGVKRHHDAAAATTEDKAEKCMKAGGKAEQSLSLAAGGSSQHRPAVQQQGESARHKLHNCATTTAAAAAVAAVKKHVASTGVMVCTPTKAKQQQTSFPVGQPSASTAAAAARLAAAFTPPGKKRKGSRETHAAALGATAGAALAAWERSRGVFTAAAAAVATVIGDAKTHLIAERTGAAGGGSWGLAGDAQHSCQQQPLQQQFDSEQCQPTLAFAVGSDGTQETVKLPEQQHKQQQQHQQSSSHRDPQPTAAVQSGTDSIDLSGSAVAVAAAHGTAAATAGGSEKHTRQPRFVATSKQAAAPQRQQQQDLGCRSPAWRAVRGTKSTAGGGAAAAAAAAAVSNVRGSSRSSSTGRGNSPQAKCAQQHMQPRAERIGAKTAGVDSKTESPGTTAGAESDSDFDRPAQPKLGSKQQQQQYMGMQQKVSSRRSQLADDSNGTAESLEEVPQQPQQQQQPAPVRHGGRRRGVTPVPPPPPLPPAAQVPEHLVMEDTGQRANKQTVPGVEDPKQQQQHVVGQVVDVEGQASKPVVAATSAVAPSRYTVVCSKPKTKQQASAAAALPVFAPTSCNAVNSTAEAGCFDTDRPAGNENKQPGSTRDFKYQEVVRKKAAREALNAFECEECRKFYTALQSWGAAGQLGLPTCGHAAPKGAAAASVPAIGATAVAGAGAGSLAGQQQQQTAVHQLVQNAGRHRAKWQPPSTPPGFWHIGFTPDHESLEVRQ